MVDSTAIAVIEDFNAERPKSAVLKQPSTERPRCTPTSTLSAPSFYCTADDLLNGYRERPDCPVEVEHLTLQLVDPLCRIGAPA